MFPPRHHVAHGTFVRRWLHANASLVGLEIFEEPEDFLVERYFDTEDGRLRRAGLALVESRGAHAASIALSSIEPGAPGARSGPSAVGQVLPRAALPAGSSFDPSQPLPDPVARAVRPLIGRHPLRLSTQARTRTSPLVLLHRGIRVLRIHLDEIDAAGPDSEPRGLHAVRVEALDPAGMDWDGFLAALATSCALTPAPATAALDALRWSGLPMETTLELGSTQIDRAMTIGEVAFAALRKQLAAAWTREPGVRLGLDPEELHDFRVAIRRMRAALSLYDPFLPVRVLRLRPLLRWLMRGTSEVRDLDVQLAELESAGASLVPEDREGLGPLLAALSRKRARARERMLRLLDSKRAELLFARAAQALRRGPPARSGPSHRPAAPAAAELILERHRKLVRQGKRITAGSPPEAFHRARIVAKRLRYAIEFHADLFGLPAARYLRRLAKIQDLLGRHQDAVVASQRLRALLAEANRTVGARTIFLIGIFAERSAHDAARHRRDALRAFDSVRGKRWKELREELESSLRTEMEHATHALSTRHRHRPRRPELPGGRGAPSDARGSAADEAVGRGAARDEGELRDRAHEPAPASGANGSDRGGRARNQEVPRVGEREPPAAT